MKFLKRTIAILLTLMIVSGSFVCFAAENEKQYHKYEKYVLLGDSEASGYRDYEYRMTEFTYAPDSYSDFLSKDLGAELVPLACPGFRTIELRYILDDNYVTQDKYLFGAVPNTSKEQIDAMIPEIRKEIADADLITIGIGGNDWGGYLGWVLTEIRSENRLPEDYIVALEEYLATATTDDDIIGGLVDLANYMNALPDLVKIMPEAIAYAFTTLNENWDYIVNAIYDLNPDVTLVVVGLFNTTLSTKQGQPDIVAEPDPISAKVEQMIVDYGNKPMIDKQSEYNYIYVDTTGTIVEVSHPTVTGHRFIADRILEELPDARFDLTDVKIGTSEYKAVEYMYVNGLMTGNADKTFGGNAYITKDEFATVVNGLGSTLPVIGFGNNISKFELRLAAFMLDDDKSITDFFTFIGEVCTMLATFTTTEKVTKNQVAVDLYEVIK